MSSPETPPEERDRRSPIYSTILNKDRYTPVTPALLARFEQLRLQLGSWENVADRCRVSTRYLRWLRSKSKTISLTQLDLMFTRCEVGHWLREFKFYTAEELLEQGVWGQPLMMSEVRQPLYEKWQTQRVDPQPSKAMRRRRRARVID